MPEDWTPTTEEIDKAWTCYEMLHNLAEELWQRYEQWFVKRIIDEQDVPFLEPPEPGYDLEDDIPF